MTRFYPQHELKALQNLVKYKILLISELDHKMTKLEASHFAQRQWKVKVGIISNYLAFAT